jgi:hypothetical protein
MKTNWPAFFSKQTRGAVGARARAGAAGDGGEGGRGDPCRAGHILQTRARIALVSLYPTVGPPLPVIKGVNLPHHLGSQLQPCRARPLAPKGTGGSSWYPGSRSGLSWARRTPESVNEGEGRGGPLGMCLLP